jgi:hypothetical protein
MRDPGMPLLRHRPIFHSGDAEAVRDFITSVGFDITIGRRDGARETCINGIYLRDSYVGYIQYGAAARIRTTPRRTDFWLQLPLRGAIEISAEGSSLDCDTHTGALGSPTREHTLAVGEGSARIQISITGPALSRHLAALLGDAPSAPLEMALAIDLRSGFGRKLCSYLRLALADFERDGASWTAAAVTEFEQTLMTMLLLEHPNNHRDLLRRLARPIAPRAVKRAVDFMHANLAAPVTLADIVGVTGVAGRTLFEHFRVFKGTSPMRYLRDARLAEVHRGAQAWRARHDRNRDRHELGLLSPRPFRARLSPTLRREPAGDPRRRPARRHRPSGGRRAGRLLASARAERGWPDAGVVRSLLRSRGLREPSQRHPARPILRVWRKRRRRAPRASSPPRPSRRKSMRS